MELQSNKRQNNENVERFNLEDDHSGFELYKGTIAISVVADAIQIAQEKGIDTDHVLIKSGIHPDLFQSSKARVSIQSFGQMWIELANQLNDEFFAMDSHPLKRGSFKLLSEMLIHSNNLRKSIQMSLDFFNLVMDDLNSKLFVQENYAYIVINDLKQSKSMFCYATYIMLIHSLMCWLSGQRIVLNQIQLKCSAPVDDQDYKVRFCENIHYQCEENYLQFDANYLNIAVKQDKKIMASIYSTNTL